MFTTVSSAVLLSIPARSSAGRESSRTAPRIRRTTASREKKRIEGRRNGAARQALRIPSDLGFDAVVAKPASNETRVRPPVRRDPVTVPRTMPSSLSPRPPTKSAGSTSIRLAAIALFVAATGIALLGRREAGAEEEVERVARAGGA
ncbi:MAG: hypothetical protein AAGB93_02570, partial [Planctomycetota bacterium]